MVVTSNNNVPFEKFDDIIKQVVDVAGFLWEKGWAERNAGNISMRISNFVKLSSFATNADKIKFQLPGNNYQYLKNQWFLISGTEKRMRDITNNPLENLLIIHINKIASAFTIYPLSSNSLEIQPTSELATHLLLHNELIKKKSNDAVVLHAHVTSLIVLTHIINSEKTLNNILLQMHPEIKTYLPDGIGFVPLGINGLNEITQNTLNTFYRHGIGVWEKHGAFSVGTNLYDAFDKIDLIAKAAEIWLLARKAGLFR